MDIATVVIDAANDRNYEKPLVNAQFGRDDETFYS
jgi:hypothetical protein